MSKENVMLKKFYNREVEREAVNEAAKENSERDENKIVYDKKHPLVIDKDTQILELSIVPDEDEDESIAYMKRVRIRFKDMETEYEKEEDEKNPYSIDINTTLTLEALESELLKCNSEDEVYELDDN